MPGDSTRHTGYVETRCPRAGRLHQSNASYHGWHVGVGTGLMRSLPPILWTLPSQLLTLAGFCPLSQTVGRADGTVRGDEISPLIRCIIWEHRNMHSA
jgi:hypothetical protein